MTPMERDCPKCPFSPMEEKTVHGVAVDECPKCGGRWYDAGELGRSVQSPEKLRQAMMKGPLKPRAGDAMCPICSEKMVNGGLVNEFLRVDLCTKCQGFWLDKNEIGLIDRLLDALN